jgi:uncharacterized membrane protein
MRRDRGCMAAMSDDTEIRTPDEIRRSELIARVNEHNAPSRPMNPYAMALGWIGFVALAIGLILIAVGANSGSVELVVGACFAFVGTMTLVILLGAQAVNWQLRRQAR